MIDFKKDLFFGEQMQDELKVKNPKIKICP